jgi:Xaa-Pro dipeptidase
MCVTVEPGIYFIERLLKQAQDDTTLSAKFNWETINAYKQEIQAVRVEDMIRVTSEGAEMLTDHLPRTVEQIESCMATGEWN